MFHRCVTSIDTFYSFLVTDFDGGDLLVSVCLGVGKYTNESSVEKKSEVRK